MLSKQSFLSKITGKSRLPTELLILGPALLIGLFTGVGAILFRELIKAVEWVGYTWIPRFFGDSKAYVLIVPALGGLLVGLLVYHFAREAKGHGVPEVMEAVALRGGRIRPIVAVVKSLASSLSIGTGGSVGREGPIVQIGSALGSFFGQKLKLSDERIRNLVGCGAAGGIAATFNAPIAGVIFALEVILGDFSVQYFSSLVVSAVTASVIGRAYFGNTPAFAIPFEYGLNSLWEFALYPILGLVIALIGMLYVRLLYWSEDVFARWKSVPEWFQPAVGGVLLGVLALTYPLLTGIGWGRMPQIFNVGYEVIESALAGQLTLKIVLAFLILKLIATSLTLGSGGSGGVFAPGLFMGAMAGTAFELIANRLFPEVAVAPGAYALVGMGALFAATAHAPISAVLILFELTGDYKIILPLMLTVVIATVISKVLLKGDSIYTLKLSRRGVHLQQGKDVDILQGVFVNEIMQTNTQTISFNLNLLGLSDIFKQSRRNGIAVLNDEGKLWGIVTITDLERAINEGKSLKNTLVKDIATGNHQLLTAYPDETIGDALTRMGRRGIGRLPVVKRDDPQHLLGMVRREDIVKAYNLALTKRAEIQHRTKRRQMDNLDGTEFVEIRISAGSKAIGQTVKEIAAGLPAECILVSIRRSDALLIPHGDTALQADDLLTAFIQSKDAEAFYTCFKTLP